MCYLQDRLSKICWAYVYTGHQINFTFEAIKLARSSRERAYQQTLAINQRDRRGNRRTVHISKPSFLTRSKISMKFAAGISS
jgi:hypothetical protein